MYCSYFPNVDSNVLSLYNQTTVLTCTVYNCCEFVWGHTMKADLIWKNILKSIFHSHKQLLLSHSCVSPQRWHNMFAWGNNCTELWLTGQLNKTWAQVFVQECLSFADVWPLQKFWDKLMILPPLPTHVLFGKWNVLREKALLLLLIYFHWIEAKMTWLLGPVPQNIIIFVSSM